MIRILVPIFALVVVVSTVDVNMLISGPIRLNTR